MLKCVYIILNIIADVNNYVYNINVEKVIIENFESYQNTIPKILTECGLSDVIKEQNQILIKPNLTTNVKPPTTTPVQLVEEIIKFCQKNSQAKIIIGEGSGGCDTTKAFEELGYLELSKKYQIELLDLNRADRVYKNGIALPKIAFESFIINVPVLKEHSAAKLTAAMKNVFGFYLNREYVNKIGRWAGSIFRLGWWNKSELHMIGVNKSIVKLNQLIKFDFNIVDGSIGQRGNEVHGTPCKPPIGKIIAGYDPKEVDKQCALLLKLDPQKISYLS